MWLGTCSPASSPWPGAHRWVWGQPLSPHSPGPRCARGGGVGPGGHSEVRWGRAGPGPWALCVSVPPVPVTCARPCPWPTCPAWLSAGAVQPCVLSFACLSLDVGVRSSVRARVQLCLTVSLCPSVLCSWTLLRMEGYEFFVSPAHPGPGPAPGHRPWVFSAARLGPQRLARPCPCALPPVLAGCTSGSVSPPACLRPQSSGLLRAWSEPLSTETSLSREPSLWGLVTGRSSRPHSRTPCPSAAAAWPCSSASWVRRPPCPARASLSSSSGGWWSESEVVTLRACPLPQALPTCCLCSALRSRSTRCSSCPGATSGSRMPAGGSWPCCSPSDTGAQRLAHLPAHRLAPTPRPA